MEKIKLKVNAKINLSLDILDKYPDNYHKLDMILNSINLFDQIEVEKRTDKFVKVNYTAGQTYKNDIAKIMAEMLISKYNCKGVNITIEKHIPEKAGVGGSSADAAGVLYAMTKLNDINLENIKTEDIEKIGSDIIFMLYGGSRRVRGKGEILSTNIEHEPLYLVLLVDDLGVNTKQSYNNFSQKYNQVNTFNLVLGLIKNDLKLVSKNILNVLTESSMMLNQNILENMKNLKNTNPLKIFMTGSGSGVLALYENHDKAEKAFDILQNKRKFLIKTEPKSISEIN